MAFLELNNITKLFPGGFKAVEQFDMKVEKGEFISFLGPSGCGKTTTLRMIAGFEFPTTGSIWLDGKDITRKPPNQRHLGMVFQSYALFPNMTVADNIGFGLKVSGAPKDQIDKRVNEMLDLIHMLEKRRSYPYQLSGGQQQRVALARALAIHPQVLLLDEPLSALDAKIRLELRSEIKRIQQMLGITTIFVTHDQEEALSISDRTVVMSSGRMEQVGTPFEIYNFPTTEFVAQFVGTLNTLYVDVVDAAAGILRLEGQQIQTSQSTEGLENGSTIMIALRPERISFASDGRKPNVLVCTIKTITFLGSIVRIQGAIGSKLFNMETFNNPFLELPKIGDEAEVTFSREAVLLLGSNREVKSHPDVLEAPAV
jgi:putative spermidine/putrescine transport system ATP-binding protein